MEHLEGKKKKIRFQHKGRKRTVSHMHTKCTQLLASELQSSVWLNIWCQLPPFHSKTNWTAASSRRTDDITRAAWRHATSFFGGFHVPLQSQRLFIQPWRSCGVTRMQNEMSPAPTFTTQWLCLWPLWPTCRNQRKRAITLHVWARRKLIGCGRIVHSTFWGPAEHCRERHKNLHIL